MAAACDDSVPPTAALDVTVPDVTAPDVIAPDVIAPDVAALDVAVPDEGVPPPIAAELPDRVLFRTATRSFNQHYYVALHQGQIWVKPNSEAAVAAEGPWRVLGDSGLPEGGSLPRFGAPQSIVELSADGIHLHALSAQGHFYRGDNLTNSWLVEGTFNWTDRWGWPLGEGPGMSAQWSPTLGWSVSDSHPLGVGHYEDLNGTQHPVGLGVAHIYRLGPDGRRVHFNDWVLPNDWSRQICGPQRGTFTAVNISASASTIFLLGADGRMFTRLYDFDTGGENPLLTYSYIVPEASGTTRRLPAEPWHEQPSIGEGEVTTRITIFRDGQGNAARGLRVEGTRQGQTGFFFKQIYDTEWQFEVTDRPLEAPLVTPAPAAPPAPDDQAMTGALTSDGGGTLALQVDDFNIHCSPSHVRLSVGGAPVTVAGQPLEMELHHVHTLVTHSRDTLYWQAGEAAPVQAALLIPHTISQIDAPAARQAVVAMLGGRAVVNLLGSVGTSGATLSEIMWSEPFRVPAEEKALFGGLQLVLAP